MNTAKFLPTRFIFNHSALREGWDNPNVFQICTLKQSDSSMIKRQEVGRGLRLCVNQDGDRQDIDVWGEQLVQEINKLTVIASESYAVFVDDLQKGIKADLYDRPTIASIDYFNGKCIKTGEGYHAVTIKEATAAYNYLVRNGYVDDDGKITTPSCQKARKDSASRRLLAITAPIGRFLSRKAASGIFISSPRQKAPWIRPSSGLLKNRRSTAP